MTTSATPFDSTPRLLLPDPGRLLAALPALLGFRPHHSLLLLCVEPGGTIDVVVRADYGPTAAVEVVDALGRLCRCPAAAAIAIVIDAGDDGGPDHLAVQQKLIRSMRDRLDRRGIDLAAAFGLPAVEPGAGWRALSGPPVAGTVADPRDCPVAAAMVLDGCVLHGSRAELVAQLDRDEQRSAALATELVRRGPRRRVGPRRALTRVLELVRAGVPGVAPTVGELADLSGALALPPVRDAACALAVGESAAAAEWLWSESVRTWPDPLRAVPATLLGYSAYARSAGPLAGIALGLAVDIDPGCRLARLLDQAMQLGMRPDAIRDLARSGYAVADRLGVALPPPAGQW
ncbi:DUF4192 domain-containing protein [Skermania piniformis]|uniref:DUF4192 domain-containing protein n=1 Tax=Skermania pinensis TaxID=39122 RepID=A0ABX8SBE3_9ACTN|nr:DUF4192 domain-containing protein [Skermania piniformis]QXQ15183.1 DUF4192 domain-containing protein [Skermania piniformis]